MSGMSMLSAFSSEGVLENESASSKSFPGIWVAVNEYLSYIILMAWIRGERS